MIHDSLLDLSLLSNPLFAQTELGVWDYLMIGGVILGVMFLIALLIVSFKYGGLWVRAWMSSADVSVLSLIGMGFRQVQPRVIVDAKVMATVKPASARPAWKLIILPAEMSRAW